jgi:hypothetical protein
LTINGPVCLLTRPSALGTRLGEKLKSGCLFQGEKLSRVPRRASACRVPRRIDHQRARLPAYTARRRRSARVVVSGRYRVSVCSACLGG